MDGNKKVEIFSVVKSLVACLGLLFVSINNETEQEFLPSLSCPGELKVQVYTLYGTPTIQYNS